MYNIIKQLPKPAILHIHISGYIDYDILLNYIDKYNLFNKILIDEDYNLSFYKEIKNKKYKNLVKNDIIIIKDKIKSTYDLILLGNMFYGLIKNINFYKKCYLPSIPIKMKMHNVKYIEFRVKLGTCIDNYGNKIKILDELELLYKYKDYFSIIVQYSKCNKNMYEYFLEIIKITKNTKFEQFIKGYDLTGDENDCYTLKYHYNNLKILKDKYNINYYFHAGEINNNNKSLINMEYALKLDPIRIGHGIIAFENEFLLKEIKEKNIILEICPISNKILYNYKLDINNIKKNIKNIVIGSDDDNKLKTNISHDYLYLYELGLTIDEIYQLLLNNIKFVNNYTEKEFNQYFKYIKY